MFLDSVKTAFTQRGYRVEPGRGSFDLHIELGGYLAGVMVLDYQKRASFPNIKSRLTRFNQQQKVHTAWIGASKGFSTAALGEFFSTPLLKGREVVLFEVDDGAICEIKQMPAVRLMVGVLTAKGGVGKTTISAHLAGVFAALGYPVTLVDLDPESNLKTLLGDSVDFPVGPQSRAGSIAIYKGNEWRDKTVQEGVVICDCSPAVSSNLARVLKKFDVCIIPTTLNPLGLSKQGKVILSTIEQIRAVNPTAQLIVLINNFFPEDEDEIIPLIRSYKRLLKEVQAVDARVHFVDPKQCAIRNHKALYYWGREICQNRRVHLAITSIEDKSNEVLKDYLKVVDYLEQTTPIQQIRNG